MSFYKELHPYLDYIVSIRKLESHISFDVNFPAKWVIPRSAVSEGYCETIPFEVADETKKGFSFVVENSERNVDVVMGIIRRIVEINKEKELKEELFKKAVNELKVIFDKNGIDKLSKLSFIFETDDEIKYNGSDDYERGQVVEMVGEGEAER